MGEQEQSELLDGAVDHLMGSGQEPYEHQQEAVLSLCEGKNVVLTSPTGSGKSLVAQSIIAGLLRSRPDVVITCTAPVKALVQQQYADMVRFFGDRTVGMSTGDMQINPEAAVQCCTAEILANRVLRHGSRTRADLIIMDEFHYYADRERGWAWQVPLLECRHSQFLVMSATIGSTDYFLKSLTALTGRESVEVGANAHRPVPLEFLYVPLSTVETVLQIVEADRSPAYVVHTSQSEAGVTAGDLKSTPGVVRVSKSRREEIEQAISGTNFGTPAGKHLRSLLRLGIGVHHGGLLPQYRLVVERLAAGGLLAVICGTDTLGVGVNVPIRSVLLTRLSKFDGEAPRHLSIREFRQIVGRAGRKGYDDVGYVYGVPPAHVVERDKIKAAQAQGRKKSARLPRAPEGFVGWDEKTFERMAVAPTEALVSSFRVTPQMVLSVVDRRVVDTGESPLAAMRRLLRTNHDSRAQRRLHVNRTKRVFRSLSELGLVEQLSEPDDEGRLLRVNHHLQDEFVLHSSVQMHVPAAIGRIGRQSNRTRLILGLVEAATPNPEKVLRKRYRVRRDARRAQLLAEGLRGPALDNALDDFDPDEALKRVVIEAFESVEGDIAWLEAEGLRPKGVVSEIHDDCLGFTDFVKRYDLRWHEGELLRYLTDVYRALIQLVPEHEKDEDLYSLQEWLGVFVRGVDSAAAQELEGRFNVHGQQFEASSGTPKLRGVPPLALRRSARMQCFRWVQLLAAEDYESLAALGRADGRELLPAEVQQSFQGFIDEHGPVEAGPLARDRDLFDFHAATGAVTQILWDPDSSGEWGFAGKVDALEGSDSVNSVFHSFGYLPALTFEADRC